MADVLFDRFPGHRVEVLGGLVSVEPLQDMCHARILSDVMAAFFRAGMRCDDRPRAIQRLAIWLPTGPFDYAIPDLSVVDPEIDDHMIEFNCYDPAVFRLVLEVTSSALGDELTRKPAAYASGGVPVYVIVDRTNQRVMVLTEPQGTEYRVRAVHHPGESFTLPESIGVSVTIPVNDLVVIRP
ncbi:Uma2 family endonuclease [Kitasatospora sp. NPDC093806]|uniref:Uma2 family endonuclease n=1 Tax=Kitasatospora sp. NPDC093806 TaxID=3155075 RepID=UPI0034218280